MMTDPELLTADILPAHALSGSDIAAWRAIAAANPALNSPFLSPEFTLAVSKARSDVRVAAIRDRGLPLAYLPFQFEGPWQRRGGGAEPVGGAFAGYFGLIAPADIQISPRDLLELAGLNALNFNRLTGPQAQALDGERPHHGLVAGLRGGWRPYWTVRCATEKAFAAEIEQSGRKLMDAHGLLRFTFDDRDPQALQRLIAAASETAGSSTDLPTSGWARSLLKILAETRALHCTGVISTLFAGETWVASHFSLCSPRTLHCWFTAQNPALAQHYPERLLLRAILEAAAARRITTVDFGVGDTPDKHKFATSAYPVYGGAWYRPSLAAFGYRLAQSLAGRLRPAAAPVSA